MYEFFEHDIHVIAAGFFADGFRGGEINFRMRVETLRVGQWRAGAAERANPGVHPFEVAEETGFSGTADAEADALDGFGFDVFGDGFAGPVFLFDAAFTLVLEHVAAKFLFAENDAAHVTFSCAAILGVFVFHGARPVFLEPFFGHEHVDVIPGQTFLRVAFAEGEFHVVVDFFDGFEPGGKVAEFIPRLETRAVLPCGFDEIRTATVGACDEAFDEGGLGIVTPELDVAGFLEALVEDLLATFGFFHVDLFGPLEGCEGFGHEGGYAEVDLGVGIDLFADCEVALTQIDDGFDVFVAFGGQSDHEVTFDVFPAALECFGGHFEQSFVGNPLVDDGAESWAGGFGGKGESGAAYIGDFVGHFDGEGVETERGE